MPVAASPVHQRASLAENIRKRALSLQGDTETLRGYLLLLWTRFYGRLHFETHRRLWLWV